MSFLTRFAVGYNGSDVHFVGPEEVAWVCGNTLLLQSTVSSRQRFLRGTSFGIQCFAINRKSGLIAFSEKGPDPCIRLFEAANLSQVAVVNLRSELGYTALAFSADGERLAICTEEPDCAVVVYSWRKGESLARGALSRPAHVVSFHPSDADLLCTTGSGKQSLWRIERLLDKTDFVQRPTLLTGHEPACHVWAPQGLYSGTSSGYVFAMDVDTAAPLTTLSPDPNARCGPSAAGDTNPAESGAAASDASHGDEAAASSSGGGEPSSSFPQQRATVGFQASSSCSPVTSMALNRDVVLVGSLDPGVKVMAHAAQGSAFKQLHEQPFSVAGIACMEFGGEEFDHAVVGARDGSVWLCHLRPDMTGVVSCTTLCSSHVGCVTGAAPHPSESVLITCGVDGSLRLWDSASASLLCKRTFSSAQTCLAAARTKALVALGSETGVLRLVSLLEDLALPVVFRRRLHTAPVKAIAFNPSSSMLVSAGRDGTLWFVSIPDGGAEAQAFGHVVAPEPILAVAWPVVKDADECILVSLVSGGIMCVTAPTARVRRPGPTDVPAEGSVSSGGLGGEAGMPQDVQLGARENVTIKILKIEVPFLSMVSVPGERYGELFGMGVDKLVHRVVLPTEGQAWAGLKGRLHKSTAKAPAHSMPGGAVAVCGTGLLLATGGVDGTITTRNPTLVELGSLDSGTGLHEPLAGGVTAVSWEVTGRYFMSAGADGCLFLFEARGTSHIGRPLTVLPAQAIEEDADRFDEAAEPTETEVVWRQSVEAALDAGKPARQQVEKRLYMLRLQLQSAVQQNELAPPLEQAERAEFIIDAELVSELKALATVRVSKVREAVKRQHLRVDLTAERVKHACWDQMPTKGLFITGMRSGLEVSNFALSDYDDSRLRKVAFLRRVEVVEHQSLGIIDGGRQYRVVLDSHGQAVSSLRHGTAEEIHEEELALANKALTAGSPAAPSVARAAADSQGAGFDELEGVLYSDFDLNTASRKAAQVLFFRHCIHLLKARFNVDFAKTAEQKKQDSDRIADLNGRMDDTLRDLQKLGGSYPALDPAAGAERFTPLFPEDMANVLQVQDQEVSVERYVSDDDRNRGEAARRVEEDGLRKAARDNALDRAVRQMMGGNLLGRAEEPDPFLLERPEWMDGNPKLFTEEQTKMLKEWMARDRVLQEEKAKRINILQMELRTMATSLDETSVRFDEALSALAAKRLQASVSTSALESRIVAMAVSIDRCGHTGDMAEQEMYDRLTALKDRKTRISSELMDKRALATSLLEKINMAQADERQLDRNFKKEFADADTYYTRLQQLYRHRVVALSVSESHQAGGTLHTLSGARVSTTPSGGPDFELPPLQHVPSLPRSSHQGEGDLFQPAGGVPGPAPQSTAIVLPHAELDPFPETIPREAVEEIEILDVAFRPEGLDAAWWDKLISYRASKVRSETELRVASASLSVLRKEVPVLEAEDATLEQELLDTMAAVNELKAGRISALYDVVMQLRLKAGQVETEPYGLVSSDNQHAVFLNRCVVENVNAQVLAKGGKKVDILTAIKDFKKGIYDLEWQHKKYDMLIQDLKNKTRELQLLHVTRDIQTIFKEGEDRNNSQEMANLEVLGRHRDKMQEKAILDKQQKLGKIGADIHGKAVQNREVANHLMMLHKVLEEQQRLQLSTHTLDDVATRRMRSMVTHRKLVEISVAQRHEITALAVELDTLRLRTYPTFPEPQISLAGHRALDPPDLRLPPLSSLASSRG